MIDVDSDGNIYTGEVFAGERAQRFVPTSSERGQLIQQVYNLEY
jgi:sugar lactone lactonase YvrE